MIILGAFLTFLLVPVALSQKSKCAPTCSGVTESGTLVPDPSNCLGYYTCVDVFGDGNFVLSSREVCPDGYFFNTFQTPARCSLISDAHVDYCTGFCNPCEIQCSVAGTLRPDPYDCRAYYLCLSGGGHQKFECPGGSDGAYFDFEAETCVDYNDKCYQFCDKCETYCVKPGNIVDPYNCQGFYVCDPPSMTHFDCPNDGYFDADTQLCSEVKVNSTCTSICHE
ncbi:low-density lipoprotein receptor-related protein 2 [Hyalella azteca]|uniref:Low-density lipoprotein receptor-related protein 2 n=1 Tax=Hyalella azteca TaxID=294128 RepID=A0A8B7NFQ4_HYAAZ|nr:low-density lipoprotein receptor-related protein 2 [Hyalella azteca]